MEIKEKVKKATPKSNHSKNETDTLQQLSQRDDIIIIKADEGGAVVIIDVDDYIDEANWQLNNIGFYKKIPNHPTESGRNIVNNTINELKLQRLQDDKTPQKKFKPQRQKHQISKYNQKSTKKTIQAGQSLAL